jgi:hypothetical protein
VVTDSATHRMAVSSSVPMKALLVGPSCCTELSPLTSLLQLSFDHTGHGREREVSLPEEMKALSFQRHCFCGEMSYRCGFGEG